MKILHILKKKPDESTKKIIEVQSKENEVRVVELYKGNIKYGELVNLVFEYDKVTCW